MISSVVIVSLSQSFRTPSTSKWYFGAFVTDMESSLLLSVTCRLLSAVLGLQAGEKKSECQLVFAGRRVKLANPKISDDRIHIKCLREQKRRVAVRTRLQNRNSE